jgi:hypothetical protein
VRLGQLISAENLDAAMTEVGSVVEPDGAADDVRWKRWRLQVFMASLSDMASEVANTGQGGPYDAYLHP